MSRHPRIPLREKEGPHAPLPFMASSSSPIPHPYQLATFHSSVEAEYSSSVATRIPRNPLTNSEKPIERAPSSSLHHTVMTDVPPLPIRLRPLLVLVLFLPIPPLLSLIYTPLGHVILRSTIDSSSTSPYAAPVLSSVEAGATGGVILSLPLAVLLYLLLLPSHQSASPDDFFEDDDSIFLASTRWKRLAGYILFIAFFLCMGGVAAPLGVLCLSGGMNGALVRGHLMLSPAAAAQAGVLGGVILSFGMLAVGVLAIVVLTFWSKTTDNSNSSMRPARSMGISRSA